MAGERRGAAVEIAGLRKEYVSGAGSLLALIRYRFERCARRVPLHCRAERLRKIDTAADSRGPGHADERRHQGRCRGLAGAERDGVPGKRPVSLDERGDQCRLRPDDARRPGGRGGRAGRGRAQARRSHQVPQPLSASALRRHAAAQRHRARLRHRSGHAADGRAVRGARCAEPGDSAGRTGAHLGADRQDRDLHHPFDRRGTDARRPHCDHDGAARPHQTDHRRAVSASAQSDDAVGFGRVRQAEARHLEGAGGRGDAGAGGGGSDERDVRQEPASGRST